MRELPIALPDGSLDPIALAILQATMMHPDDSGSIRDDIDVYRMQESKGFPKTALWKWMNAEWRAAQSGGLRAGAIFYKMAVFQSRPDLATVGMNKAAFMVASEAVGAGEPVERKLNTYKGDWTQYKNVAHFWAALGVAYRESDKQLPIDIFKWLQIAESLAEFVSPLMENWNPWRASSFLPPSAERFHPGPPDDDDIRLLTRYRASLGELKTN